MARVDALEPSPIAPPPKRIPRASGWPSRRWGWPILVLVAMAGTLGLVWGTGLPDGLRLGDLARLQAWVTGYGPWAPLLFIIGYVLLEMAFVPALPLTLLGGLAFGPLWGTAYVWVAATLSATGAFLLARSVARETVERWLARHPRLARMDGLVAEHGWRILVITRLVPLFPFNLQNFAYGLTAIRPWSYVWMTAVCILPGTAAYTGVAGAVSAGGGEMRRTLVYLGISGCLLVTLSLFPRWLRRRSRIAEELFEDQ